jgi:hypothetical protein
LEVIRRFGGDTVIPGGNVGRPVEVEGEKTRRFGFKKQANQTRTEKNTPDG